MFRWKYIYNVPSVASTYGSTQQNCASLKQHQRRKSSWRSGKKASQFQKIHQVSLVLQWPCNSTWSAHHDLVYPFVQWILLISLCHPSPPFFLKQIINLVHFVWNSAYLIYNFQSQVIKSCGFLQNFVTLILLVPLIFTFGFSQFYWYLWVGRWVTG